MTVQTQYTEAIFIKRYKRFLADVKLSNGGCVTVHCPNPGRMTSCLGEGWPVRLLDTGKITSRKYRYSLEQVYNGDCWIGVNTQRANEIVSNALQKHEIRELPNGYQIKREVVTSSKNRLDFECVYPDKKVYIEVKSVTYLFRKNEVVFPDAVTTRGQKHIQELIRLKKEGHRAILFFLVQRPDGRLFRPCHEVDPAYAAAVKRAQEHGVEILAYSSCPTEEGVQFGTPIQVGLL